MNGKFHSFDLRMILLLTFTKRKVLQWDVENEIMKSFIIIQFLSIIKLIYSFFYSVIFFFLSFSQVSVFIAIFIF